MADKTPSILLRPAPGEPGMFRWRSLGDAGAAYPPACNTPQEIAAAVGQCPLVLATPAEDTLLRQIQFTPKERRHIRESAPYLLEEDLADSIETLHFAAGQQGDNTLEMAIISRELLQGWLEELQEAGLEPELCLPEQLLLERLPGSWACYYEQELLLVSAAPGTGFVCNSETGPLLLEKLADSLLPETIRVTVQEAAAETAALGCLPEKLRQICDVQTEEPFRDIDALKADAAVIDLMQGDFSRRIPWADIWLQWRTAALLLAGILLLQGAAGYAEYRVLNEESQRMRVAATQLYQQALPSAAGLGMDSARARLQEELNKKRQSGGRTSRFTEIFARTGSALRVVPSARFMSVNYDSEKDQMRMEVDAPAFPDIQKIRNAMQRAGVSSQLINSSSKNERVRARLSCRLGGEAGQAEGAAP